MEWSRCGAFRDPPVHAPVPMTPNPVDLGVVPDVTPFWALLGTHSERVTGSP